MQRRELVRSIGVTAGGGIAVVLAGCSGDDSLGEAQASLDQAGEHLEDAGRGFDELQQHLESEDWESCLDSTDPIRDDLVAAEEDASDAQQLAEGGGHENRAEIATLELELIGIMQDMVDESEGLCEAAAEDDHEAVNRRLENLDELEQRRQQKARELDRAVEEIED